MENISIKFSNADIEAGGSTVIYDFNAEFKGGDFAYIVGKVGTGKTSIFRTIIGENALASGECEVLGTKLSSIKRSRIPYLRRHIGVIFQDFQLLADRDVYSNLDFVLGATGWKDRALMDKRIDEVLEAVDMKTKLHKMPHQLSGGEQQRIAIARAILNSPEIILADEPTGNLDSESADTIMKILRKINAAGSTVLVVTHDDSLLDRYPGRVFECRNEGCAERQ